MKDRLKELILIRGEQLDYVAALYLENGVQPRALSWARFPHGARVLSHKDGASIEELRTTVREVSMEIADWYGYEMTIVPVTETTDRIGVFDALQDEWDRASGSGPKHGLH